MLFSAWQLLSNPHISITKLAEVFPAELGHFLIEKSLITRLDIEAHYSEMVAKQELDVMDLRKSETLKLSTDIPYRGLVVPIDLRVNTSL